MKGLMSFWKRFALLMIIAMFIAPLLLFSGCADSGKVKIDTGLGEAETVSDDMGRYSAWAKVETARLSAVKSIKGEKKPETAVKENVTVVLDTPEKIQAWTNAKTTEALGRAVEKLADGQRADTLAAALQPTPMPKGAVAEAIDSTGHAVESVANTPTAVASSVGITAVQLGRAAISGAEDKTTVDGDGNQVSITKAKTTTTTAASGTGQATGTATGGNPNTERTKTEAPVAEAEAVPQS